MRRARVAWTVALADVVAVTIVMVLSPLIVPSGSPTLDTVAGGLLFIGGIAAFSTIGALLITRVPTNLIGMLLLVVGTILIAAIVIGEYGTIGALQRPPWPGSSVAATIGNAMVIYPILIALIGIPLYFPNGRLPTPRFRWIVRITIAFMIVWAIEAITGVLRDNGLTDVVPGLLAVAPILDALEIFMFVATFLIFGGAVVAVWLRFRRGDPVERQQVKWLVAVVAFGAVIWPLSFVIQDRHIADALSIIGIVGVFALPIVIGIAILRYRLYEIDRIISRTIGYAVVTGILAAVFAAAILLLQGVLATFTQGQTVAVAASTLAVFALFQPLRRRVQGAVDRRFNRARYDAERTAIAFSERLRNETDMEKVTTDLARTAQLTVSPTTMTIWLRRSGSS
jgi:hypothetical protein